MDKRTVAPIELVLSVHDLYPPLQDASSASVTISSNAPPGEVLQFDYSVAGEAGTHEGLTLHAGNAGGALFVSRAFIAAYQGTWPASVEVRAWQDGTLAASAELRLYDTRTMQVERAELTLHPDPAYIPGDDGNPVTPRPTFFDSEGISLPLAEVSWAVRLPDLPQGIEVIDRQVIVRPGAEAGTVLVALEVDSQEIHTSRLTLLPTPDIGMELSRDYMYPPLLFALGKPLGVETNLPLDAPFSYTLTLNGDQERHEGLYRYPEWILFDNRFFGSYQGSWPIEMKVYGIYEQQVIAVRTCWLLDTREMECTKVDLEYVPSDAVHIPAQGEVVVIVAPRFYDAEGRLLPHDEIDWGANLVKPVDGVIVDKHVLTITSRAQPGFASMTLHVPNGLSRTRVLHLL